MSLDELFFEAALTIAVVGSFFIAYRALRLRSALVDRPYRTRALGTAIGALTIVGFISSSTADGFFGNTPTTVEGVVVEGIAWGFTFVALLGWIVTNNNVAINADYFNRDALLWRAGGKWVVIGIVLALWISASLPSWWLPSWFTNNSILPNVLNALFFLAVAYAAIVLVITVRRIRDRSIRTFTIWVVVSIVLLWSTVGASSVSGLLGIVVGLAYLYAMNHTVSTLAIRTRTLTA